MLDDSSRASNEDYAQEHVQQQDSKPLTLFDLLRILRAAGGTLYTQATLHTELIKIDWAEEKSRLQRMFLFSMLGVVCLLCTLLFSGLLILLLTWETSFRLPSLIVLIGLYALGTLFAWRRFNTLSRQSDKSFAATKKEIATDISVLRSNL